MTNWTQNDLEPPLVGVAYDGEDPVDLSSASELNVTVRRPDGTAVSGSASTSATLGEWSYAWVEGDLSQHGTYVGELEVTWPGVRPQTFGPYTFTVAPELDGTEVILASWAQKTDVMTYTGVAVTDSDVMQAQAQVEIFCGRTFLVPQDTMRTRDLYYLKLAVSYQAAWLIQQPDYFSRSDVSQINQDGMGITFDPNTAGKAMMLAPMARRAIKRVSWMRSRSMHTNPADANISGLAPGSPIVDYENESWHSFGMGGH